MRICKQVLIGWMVWISLATANAAEPQNHSETTLQRALRPLVGPKDAVLVTSPHGTALAAINENRLLVPASILKLITVSAALDRLGKNYRFKTEFYLDGKGDLIIKGYGDPLLISERIATIAATLAGKLPSYRHLILDDSYFSRGLAIPGRTVSEQPYDAPNGALSVNFNTVAFRREKGRWISDEPQTPLLTGVIPKIEASGLTAGRITLAADSDEALQYTGSLFHYFFNQAGLDSENGVNRGRARVGQDRLIWRYLSEDDLGQVAKALLEFSNNFIANQILLVMGAETYGPPATIDKGLGVLRQYGAEQLGMTTGHIAEASGISRQNRLSARTMMTVLERLEPYHRLLRQTRSGQFYKTGHLRGIRTRAGYLTSHKGERYRYVVILNTAGKTTHPIMRILKKHLL